VVEVVGPESTAAVDACFLAANGRLLADQPLGAIRFGRWLAPDGEELIVCRATEATIEVHCHGGLAAVRAVVESLILQGCTEQTWQDQLSSALGSAIQAEARIALANCTTDRTAAILLDQLDGALEGQLREIQSGIQQREFVSATEKLTALLGRSALGLHLTQPWRVVLAGPPNVGKSSLINALLGYERAVVFDQPGVTRDVVTASTAIAGWPVELADTAGLRPATNEIEAAGVALARQVLAEADMVLLVDEFGPQPLADERIVPLWAQQDELQLAPHQTLLRVANKLDRAPAGWQSPQPCQAVSATTGAGVDQLLRAIGQGLAGEPPPAGAAAPFTLRQVGLIEQASQAAASHQSETCLAAMQALLAPDRGNQG